MSLGFNEILKDEKEVLMDRGVWGGAVGSLAGYFLASQQNWGTGPTMLAIGGGHFAGHSAVAIMHDM